MQLGSHQRSKRRKATNKNKFSQKRVFSPKFHGGYANSGKIPPSQIPFPLYIRRETQSLKTHLSHNMEENEDKFVLEVIKKIIT